MKLAPTARAVVLDIDLSAPTETLRGHEGYDAAWALVRDHGTPLGFATIPLRDGAASAETVRAAVDSQVDTGHRLDPAAYTQHAGPWPSLTVAVCTRDRPEDLRRCLDALEALEYNDLEVLVVDNAPATDAAAQICQDRARVRYVAEPRPGLNWARNRAVLETTTEILAFTDDDVLVDTDWARALVYPFTQNPETMVVAGLVVPFELETQAQIAFEQYGGLSGGTVPIELQGAPEWGVRGFWHYVLMAQQLAGANLAFRHSVFARAGSFDPSLDVGTPSNGGGDAEMVFRVLARGGRFRYEPQAIVRHRHRREIDKLEHQIEGWGSGVYAFLTRSALAYPRAWWVLALIAARGLSMQLARLASNKGLARRLALAELRGALSGPARYFRGQQQAADTERAFGPQSPALPS